MNDLQILQILHGLPDEIAPLNSPQFKGVPTAPTADKSNASNQIATTAFVDEKVHADIEVVQTDLDGVKEEMKKFDGLDMDQIKEEVKQQIENNLSNDIIDSLSTQSIRISYSDIGIRQNNILKQIDTILDILNQLDGDNAVTMATYKATLGDMKNTLINYYSTMNVAYEACIAKTGTYADFSEKFNTWYSYTGDVLAYMQTILNKLNAYMVGKKADATQKAIFDLLTDNGRMQGIYYADVTLEDGTVERQLFINGEYAQLKGCKVKDVANNTTFAIGKDGSVTINATSFKVTGRSIETLVSESMASSDTITNAVNKATQGIRTEIDNLTQSVDDIEAGMGNVSETVKDAIKDDIITEAEFSSLSSLYNDICARQTAVIKEINAVLSLTNIDNNDKNSLTNYRTSVNNTFKSIQDSYNIMTNAIKITPQMFIDFDRAVTNWNTYVGTARSFCQTVLNNITTKLTSDKLSNTRQAVFNALTENGTIQGLFMSEDQLYINGEYIQAKDIKAEDSLIAESLTVKKINCNKAATMLQAATSVRVNPNSYYADDANDFENGAVFKTLQGAINACPVCLNGKSARIYLDASITENIEIRGKNGGTLYIYMCGNSIYGTVKIWDSTGVLIYGGSTNSDSMSVSARPVITPYSMIEYDSYYYTVLGIRTNYIYLKDVNVYGKVYNGTSEKVYKTQNRNYCIASARGTTLQICNVSVVHTDNGCHAIRGGKIISQDAGGYCNRYGYYASYGGEINICRDTAIGGATKNYTSYDNETITVSNNVTFASSGVTQSSTNIKDSSTKVATSETLISDYGYSYRTTGTYAKSWSSDGVVRQGKWSTSLGMNKGFWFFGSDFDEFVGKTITKVTLTLTRQAAGAYGSGATATLKYHEFTTKAKATAAIGSSTTGPAVSSWSKSLSVKAYSTAKTNTFEITDSDLLNAISKGTCKGFALYNTSGSYQQYSGSLKVMITYK